MNREKVKKLADLIRGLEYGREPGKFYMGSYVHNEEDVICHSPACLAGWTCLMEGCDLNEFKIHHISLHGTAMYILGITSLESDLLFVPSAIPYGPSVDEIYGCSGAQAAKVLDHFADTGEIDWRHIRE